MSDAELGDELQELRARASAAETSLLAAEDALQLQKDKYLRLNADWENYRKRTVRTPRHLRHAQWHPSNWLSGSLCREQVPQVLAAAQHSVLWKRRHQWHSFMPSPCG